MIFTDVNNVSLCEIEHEKSCNANNQPLGGNNSPTKGKRKLIFTYFSLLFFRFRQTKQIFLLTKASGPHFLFGNNTLTFIALLS